jgi:hypothetical protein
MPDSMNSAQAVAEDVPSLSSSIEAIAEQTIAECGGDARAAVVELIGIINHLSEENRALLAASSPGFARRPPRSRPRTPADQSR